MERGLRQGDPLSPFLLVLVVDVLHRMMGEAVRNDRISSLLVGRDNIELSHLQFADDTILFCPQETETLVNYKRLLRCFELMSGLSINFEKSSLISVNCEKEWVTNMCDLLGCAEAVLLVRYLGISLGANPRLSVYYLSLYKMPKGVAEKIIGLQRRFLWGKEDGNNGIPLVKWIRNRELWVLGWARMGIGLPMEETTLPMGVRVAQSTSRPVMGGKVWCAWLTFTDSAWTTPGTVKEFFESWTGVTGGKSEQKKWLIGFYAVI
ncbi:uncharacterized protein LOC107490518 [Arachis duranensis]|uniref:Uncharacterized protein LOC107490518 n=1 Tax=Arachis duranensis TaxID=130453 RepID=A0A6P4DM82_ARADU|nr:uncharacterized protein LOC107490518 [Arachis duranensis]